MSALFDEHKQHYDPDTGKLLVGAKIYIGDPGLDPKLNPKNIYDNRGLTGAPLAQPQLTGADGRSINKIWVSGRYSFIIDSSADVEKYNELQNGSEEAVGNIQTTNSLGVNDIVATGDPVQTSYIDNKTYIVTAPADNTGAMTINLDAIGVIPIKKGHDQAIVSGDVKAGMKLVLVYNSTDGWMELQSAVLGSVFGGSIQVGQDIVLTEQADHSSTPAAGFGYLWVKSDTPSSLIYTDDAGNDSRISSPAAATGHIKAGNIQIVNGATTVNSVDLTSLIIESAVESFGPTGSGATNIWTAMDNLTTNATILIVDIYLGVSTDSATASDISVYACSGDETLSPSLTNNFMANLTIDMDAAITGASRVLKRSYIPLGANQIFKAEWQAIGNDEASAIMYYRGFITD